MFMLNVKHIVNKYILLEFIFPMCTCALFHLYYITSKSQIPFFGWNLQKKQKPHVELREFITVHH